MKCPKCSGENIRKQVFFQREAFVCNDCDAVFWARNIRHELKTVQPYFDAVADGIKTFEVRSNDRDFHVGETLILQEFMPPETYTGKELRAEIVYILDVPEYVKPGYAILGIEVYGRNF